MTRKILFSLASLALLFVMFAALQAQTKTAGPADGNIGEAKSFRVFALRLKPGG